MADVTVSITGVYISALAGIVLAGEGATVALTPVVASGAVQSVSIQINQPVLGVPASLLSGTIVQSSLASLASVISSGSVGTVTPSEDQTIQLTSVSANGILPLVSIETDGYLTIASADGLTGIVTPIEGAAVFVTGVSASGSVGTVVPYSLATVIADASVGLPTIDMTVGLTQSSPISGLTGVATPTQVPYSFNTYDRIEERVTGTNGTNVLNINGTNVTGFGTFNSKANQYQLYYTVTDGTNWETGLGAYVGTSGAGTITTISVLSSSNAGAAITKTVGMIVYITYTAAYTAIVDNAYNCLVPFGPTNSRVGVNNIALSSSMSS